MNTDPGPQNMFCVCVLTSYIEYHVCALEVSTFWPIFLKKLLKTSLSVIVWSIYLDERIQWYLPLFCGKARGFPKTFVLVATNSTFGETSPSSLLIWWSRLKRNVNPILICSIFFFFCFKEKYVVFCIFHILFVIYHVLVQICSNSIFSQIMWYNSASRQRSCLVLRDHENVEHRPLFRVES